MPVKWMTAGWPTASDGMSCSATCPRISISPPLASRKSAVILYQRRSDSGAMLGLIGAASWALWWASK